MERAQTSLKSSALPRVVVAAVILMLIAPPAMATPNAPPTTSEPRCALSGAADVRVEGKGMLRLGDVQGCDGVRWEIIQGVFINGQPAVRLLPSEECGVSGSESVLADGAPVSRQGDAC